ncbi:YppG family protein [Lentibacillus sp. N15]|uniref:YppG family protein n=1 Tax=Lentibacillus songyuanensis TaxID=3136161 RepID=UPI0031BBB637
MSHRPFFYQQPYRAYGDIANYQQLNAYHQQWPHQQFPYVYQTYPPSPSPFTYFAKPPQPTNWYAPINQQQQSANVPHPQPKQNGLLALFQDKDGQVDLDKMFSTVGQFANTFQQITPVVKQVGSFMKNL